MALHATARESNIIDSLKKFFIDNLETIEGYSVTFDKALSAPKLYGGKSVEKWVSVKLPSIDLDSISTIHFDVFCCTRRDNEGFKLAQVRDKVMGYLTNDGSPGDGKISIPFYQSHPIDPWTLLGGMLIINVFESDHLEAPDETKYKILTVQCRFAVRM